MYNNTLGTQKSLIGVTGFDSFVTSLFCFKSLNGPTQKIEVNGSDKNPGVKYY